MSRSEVSTAGVPGQLAQMSDAKLNRLEQCAEADEQASPEAKERLREHIARERDRRKTATLLVGSATYGMPRRS